MIDQAAVSYALSFAALREMRKRRVAPRWAAPVLVAFGNPTLGDEVIERLQRTYTGLKLAETETSGIDKLPTLYGPRRARMYTAAHAKKNRLRTEANAATILHLATPVVLDQLVPMYSLILMSPDAADDGVLKLSEITSLNSKAWRRGVAACLNSDTCAIRQCFGGVELGMVCGRQSVSDFESWGRER